MSIEALKNRLPDYAKDIKLNLGSLAGEVSLTTQQRAGTFIASALASRNAEVTRAILAEFGPQLSHEALTAAQAAAAIMGMNNVYYRFVHLVGGDYERLPARLRMNIIGKPGVEKVDFELWSLAVSAVNGCGMCLTSHEKILRDAGYTQLSLDLYGRGETESVAARIRQLDLTTMVTLRGWTPQDELYRELEHHDLFIFPTWSREPFAIAPLDAGARGCVPLVSSPSGPAEWLVDGVHYLAARRDPTAFASVIRQVLDGEIDLAAIGRRAAALVRSEYTLDRVLPIIEEELEGRVGQGHDPVGTSNELHRMAVIAEAMGRRWVTEASAR